MTLTPVNLGYNLYYNIFSGIEIIILKNWAVDVGETAMVDNSKITKQKK